jgi:hypothetical protein
MLFILIPHIHKYHIKYYHGDSLQGKEAVTIQFLLVVMARAGAHFLLKSYWYLIDSILTARQFHTYLIY